MFKVSYKAKGKALSQEVKNRSEKEIKLEL